MSFWPQKDKFGAIIATGKWEGESQKANVQRGAVPKACTNSAQISASSLKLACTDRFNAV